MPSATTAVEAPAVSRPECIPAFAEPEIVMSAEAIPAVATNAVEAISSFFILNSS
jgi:hypothetical protein